MSQPRQPAQGWWVPVLLTGALVPVLVAMVGWPSYEAGLRARVTREVLADPSLAAAIEGAVEDRRVPGGAAAAPAPTEAPARAGGPLLGEVLAYAGAPDVKRLFEQGYMLCNGQRLVAGSMGWEPGEFEALFTALGTAWGGGVGPTGQRFLHLPDLRGIFLRGVDAGAGRDPEAARRGPDGEDLRVTLYAGGNTGDRVGSFQPDTAGRPRGFTPPGKTLFHACTQAPSPDVACPPVALYAPRWFQREEDERWVSPARGPEVDTRPKNAAVHWIVRVR